MTDPAYTVGYGRPPVHSRFQKGGGGNRPGRRKAAGRIDIEAILEAPVSVEVSGRKRRKSPFEIEFTSLLRRALKGELPAIRAVLLHCERAGLMDGPVDDWPGFLRIPKHWDDVAFMEMYNKHGLPPWPGPDDGLIPEYRRKPRFAGRTNEV